MKKTKAKKKHPRLERPKKQYALDQCGLFHLRGVGELMRTLKWQGTRQDLEDLPGYRGSYKVWKNDRGRAVQEAAPSLRKIQARIAVLLRRIVPPEYRHSGVRDRSFLTNAQQHTQLDPSIKLDINSFYPTTSFQHVRKFFVEVMNCAGDVAFLLAKLCCYRQKHLPTGGVHSEVVAFYCHRGNFDQLMDRVHRRGGIMTVYVDDIMVTMPGASLTDLEWARRLFARQKVKLHPGKCRVIRKAAPKFITGVEIHKGKINAPKAQHLMIKQRLAEIRNAPSEEVASKAVGSLLGHLDHVAQINPKFQNRAHGTRGRFKALIPKPELSAPSEVSGTPAV